MCNEPPQRAGEPPEDTRFLTIEMYEDVFVIHVPEEREPEPIPREHEPIPREHEPIPREHEPIPREHEPIPEERDNPFLRR